MSTTLVACVAENMRQWFHEVQDLALSLRHLGGPLAEAPFVACFVEAVEPEFREGLAALGAEVRVVDRFDPRNPPSNKLRMLELAETHEFDRLLMIDTDTVVVGDVGSYAPADRIAAKPENSDPFPVETWQGLFAALEIPEPAQSVRMTTTGEVTYPYYNTGVVLVPRDSCLALGEAWGRRVHELLELYESHPETVAKPQRHWTNQTAFALAVIGLGVEVTPLPVAANLSTTVRVHRSLRHTVRPPYVLHYHNEMDASGFLLRSRNRQLNPTLDAVNRLRSEVLGLAYDGMAEAPLVKRALRRVEGHAWYERGPVATVRRHRLLAPVRRQAKRLAGARPGA